MSTTDPGTRNVRSTCAFGVITAEYVVAPASVEASTVATRTAVAGRASALAPRPPHPQIATAATIVTARHVSTSYVFIDPCPALVRNRPAPSRGSSGPA